jgi:shikimate kinase
MIRNKIFLIGFMGSGKTTIGRELAARLRRDFIDLDELIAEQAGRSIPEIFAESGEEHFRKLEREALKSLVSRPIAVVALGGGAFVSDENRAEVADQGLSIWLDCELDTILGRLGCDSTRPLYAGRSPEQMAQLLAARETAYAQADLRLDVTRLKVEEAAQEIISLIRKKE